MNRALTFWYYGYQYLILSALAFSSSARITFRINSVCYGDSLLLLISVRSMLLQLMYLFRTVGENGAAVGYFAPTASNTNAMISGVSQALRSDFDNVLGFSY